MDLNYVQVFAPDPPALRDWYVDTLGLTVADDAPEFVMLAGEGGAYLGIERGDPLANPEQLHLHFAVEDVEGTFAAIDTDRVTVVDPPHETPWAHRQARLRDPVGHTVGIYAPQAGAAG